MDEKHLWKQWDNYGGRIGETTNDVHEGDIVSIAERATLWNGTEISRWFACKKWYVDNLNGNKAHLGRDMSKKYYSGHYISTNFLTVVVPCGRRDNEEGTVQS